MITRNRRIMALAGIICATTLALAPAAHALDFKGGEEIVIGPTEVYDDDLVLTATTVTVNGTVNGDLIVFARDVRINGVVTGDLMGAAQSVIVNGDVRDHKLPLSTTPLSTQSPKLSEPSGSSGSGTATPRAA